MPMPSSADIRNFFHAEDRVLIAVSGGRDSMVLLHLLQNTGLKIAVAHCNFQLRGEESDADELFVKAYCEKYHIGFFSKRFDTIGHAKAINRSIQEAARELRYEWFGKIAEEDRFDLIATAHHLNDSIETFFINLIRRSGPAGLAGIPFKRGKLIRPLLHYSTTEVQHYAVTHAIEWREDRSNAADHYLRNRLRHHLIPQLQDEEFEKDMRTVIECFSGISEYLNDLADSWSNKHNANGEMIPLSPLRSDPNAANLLSLLLYRRGIVNAECEKILRATTGKIFNTSDHQLLVDRDQLIIRRKENPDKPMFEIDRLPAELMIGKDHYHFEIMETGESMSENALCIDAGKLRLPLTVRSWQSGDRFVPLGMKGMKKVSDFLTDLKLNRFEKDNVSLLLSDNDIVCILGHRIDDRFRVTKETVKKLLITHQ